MAISDFYLVELVQQLDCPGRGFVIEEALRAECGQGRREEEGEHLSIALGLLDIASQGLIQALPGAGVIDWGSPQNSEKIVR